MQPIELVEGILRQNLTPISRAPHKCLRICDIWNQSDCLACVLEIHFGVSTKASWRYRVHYRPEDGLRRCPDSAARPTAVNGPYRLPMQKIVTRGEFNQIRLQAIHFSRITLNCREGSVATLQSPRGRLAGCSSWHLRFVVYSSGDNLGSVAKI